MMEMFMYWTAKCEFVFESWRTTDDEPFLFTFGCFLTVLYSVFHTFLIMEGESTYHKWNLNTFMPHRLFYGLYQFIISLSSIINMMIIMTMNGWVNICVAIGLTIGYVIITYGLKYNKKRLEPI